MKFTEETLEQAVIELFAAEQIPHTNGMFIHKEMSDVLLRDDAKDYLLNKYAHEDITLNEINSIIRQLEVLPAGALYESNKLILKMVADGFPFKREDRTKKDLFIQLLDYSTLKKAEGLVAAMQLNLAAEPEVAYETADKNIYRIVNQLEIQGYEKRIPDAIIYINGLPLVVFEFKTAVKEDCTIKDAYTQLTVRYKRDIPELLKYNAFCVISDGVNNKMGSFFAPYDFFRRSSRSSSFFIRTVAR